MDITKLFDFCKKHNISIFYTTPDGASGSILKDHKDRLSLIDVAETEKIYVERINFAKVDNFFISPEDKIRPHYIQ